MDELEEIRKRKLEELQQQTAQDNDHVQMQQQMDALETIVKQKMTKEAIERYSNVKLAHPEKAMQLLMLLSQSSIEGLISDEELKKILMLMEGKKKDITITRK